MRHWRSDGASQENDAAVQHSAVADDCSDGHGAFVSQRDWRCVCGRQRYRIDSDQGRSDRVVYKEMMVVSRFMVMVWAALLIVVSVSLAAPAGTTAHVPHYSSMNSPDHDNCNAEGNQDTGCQDCCHGISCASSGVLAQVARVAPLVLSISQLGPSATDHLYGRSIVPETGPPKLLA